GDRASHPPCGPAAYSCSGTSRRGGHGTLWLCPKCSTSIPAPRCVRNPTNGARRLFFGAEMKEAGRGERPMRNPAALDYWIRRHAIQVSCGPHPACGTDPAQHQRMFNPARDRRVSLFAIGQSLKDHYDALAPPMPPHLAALVEQLKMQK